VELTQQLVITGTSILVAAAVVQVLALRTPIPSILLYLGIGILLGPSVLRSAGDQSPG